MVNYFYFYFYVVLIGELETVIPGQVLPSFGKIASKLFMYGLISYHPIVVTCHGFKCSSQMFLAALNFGYRP